MDTAQIWAVIGVLAAAFFGMMTLTSTLFLRVIRSEIGGVRGEICGVRGEIGSLRREMDARFNAVDVRFSGVENRLDRLEHRFDGLDRDVHYLMRRESDLGTNE